MNYVARGGAAASAFRFIVSFSFLAALLVPAAALAQAQGKEQQVCLKKLHKAAAKSGKAQNKANAGCAKLAFNKQPEKMGRPDQDRNTDACLTNDPKGKLAKIASGVDKADQKSCQAVPPDFGRAPAGTMGGAGPAGARAIYRDIFGLNLDEPLRRLARNGQDLACQQAVIATTGKLYDGIWKEGLKAAKLSLAGKGGPAATDAATLGADLSGSLTADAKGKIAKLETRVTDAVTPACTGTGKPLVELMRGGCDLSGGGAAAASCAVEVTRCRACRALNGTMGISIDCDDFDNGAADDSCVGFASAYEIDDEMDLLTGPLAHNTVGDFMLANDVARFVIQKANVRDMYSVGVFGGNIIDAELVANPGRDNFLEIQPALNIETIVNATSVEVVNDGADGGAAIIRSCGPDDILDFINPSIIVEQLSLTLPASADDNDQNVEACTEYILEPDATYVKMVTTVFNDDPTPVGLYVGDYVNAAGELEQWTSGDAGIGARLTSDMGVLSFIGYGEAEGIDYGLTTVEIQQNLKTSFFSTSGVAYVLHSHNVLNVLLQGLQPTFTVPGGGSRSYTRYFGVGDGSGANMVNLESLVRGRLSGEVSGCVTVDGVPTAGARVTAGPVSMGNITRVSSMWVTGSDGCYRGILPVGNYGIAAWRKGTMYEGGAGTPPVHNISITTATPVVRDFDLPTPGGISLTVVDENDDPVPARISVVGFDPSPEPLLPDSTGLFADQEDQLPYGITRAEYTDATGAVDFDLEPGSYRVYVSRGPEYSVYTEDITVTAAVVTNVDAKIGRVIDTTGFVSSDFHVHSIASADSRVSNADRVRQFAGEGIDNIVLTEHHAHIDLTPDIAALGFSSFVTAMIGEEITTWDAGHYNAYPMTIDPSRPSGGSTDWGGAAPAGQDFASLGSYVLDPVDVYNLAKFGPTSTADTVVQINHIDSHFVPLQIDTSLVPPASTLSAARKLQFRMDPTSGNVFHHFDALELWNGYNRNHQGQFLNERIGIWMNHLNQGLFVTAISDTDTHKFTNLETSGARSWTASPTDDPASIDPADVANAVATGRVVGGQGVYVQTRLVDALDAGNVADLSYGGNTMVVPTDAAAGVLLEIDIQAPLWAEFDSVRVYANAATTPLMSTPQLFTATPTLTRTAGVHFAVTPQVVHGSVPGGSRLEASLSIPFTNMTEDTWFVVVVKGTDNVSRPMFPVFPPDLNQPSNTTLAHLIDGNLNQGGVLALGVTNALYADVDGNPGFDPPLVP